MGSIRILPENISNKIAAGEVIDRPSSIVKELIENSIDASAKNIYVNIENAGKKLIAVSDDGLGMDSDDALLCLEPHATSKIKEEEDISNIITMGFRGEALPSIASISRLRLRTRKREVMEGTEVIVHGGRFISETPIGCVSGADIRITDIFYNTPARKKFLKSTATEEKHIYEAFCLLALANPDISFELKINGQIVISTPSNKSILPRLGVFWGNRSIDSFIPIDYENSGIQVNGYVSKPDFVKSNRREQRFFINRRPIKTNIAYSAIRDAYDTMVMKGLYPVVILFIQLDPKDVDINVHPSKHEARFHNERLIASVIREGIRSSLIKAVRPASTVSTQKLSLNSILQGAEISYNSHEVLNNENDNILPSTDFISSQPGNSEEAEHTLEKSNGLDDGIGLNNKPADNIKINQPTNNTQKILSLPGSGIIKLVGFLDDTYMLGISDVGLIVIDQHAAHERILFEKLLNENDNKTHSQKLLLPITINLTRPEANLIKKYGEVFYRLGFEVEPFGDNTVLVTAIPPDFPMDNISGLMSDLLDDIINNNESKHKLDAPSIAKAACRLAVKAHNVLSLPEAEELIYGLAKCKLPFSCPHGRPTLINISFNELEKRFGRK